MIEIASLVMGCALGCALADAEEGRWGDVLIGVISAGLCLGAILL